MSAPFINMPVGNERILGASQVTHIAELDGADHGDMLSTWKDSDNIYVDLICQLNYVGDEPGASIKISNTTTPYPEVTSVPVIVFAVELPSGMSPGAMTKYGLIRFEFSLSSFNLEPDTLFGIALENNCHEDDDVHGRRGARSISIPTSRDTGSGNTTQS